MRDLLSGLTAGERAAFLDGLSPNAVLSLPWLFEHWAIEGHQLPPEGDWTTWVILGGRGAGKTRAGAEWVRAQVEGGRRGDPGRCSRVALVGETIDQAREVMIFGDSGLLACAPPDRRPEWQATRKRLVWPNGAVAQVFSASDPESLRGPQFDCAWCDELAKWRKGKEAWDMLQFGLRLGERPRQVVTTTPRNTEVLTALLKRAETVVTTASTSANRMHLAKSFLDTVTAQYEGTHLGRQELDGELIEDVEGALWSWALIEAARGRGPLECDRVVVAVDPPVSSGPGADECGIIVAGVEMNGAPQHWRAEIIADASARGLTPQGWAERVAETARLHGADRIVAEANQGGEMVATILRGAEAMLPVSRVHASRGKAARAEPVAALYEQGRIGHRARFPELEAQMARMTPLGLVGGGSPDRVDALVWAIYELMIRPAAEWTDPRIRGL